MKHINFADLRVFLAIADTGNLTRAAAQCCITPSAASVRLKHLEEEAGCDLVKRLPRGLALTSAGERLAAEARKVFQQITRITDAMTAFRGDERLVVRLAANYNAAVAFLPDDLSDFLLDHPDIRIDQRLFTSRGVAEVIALGEADIGITAFSDFHGGLCFYPYREDSLVLFAAHDHPLVKRQSCRFEEALEEAFVALSNEASMQTFMLAKAVELGRPIVPRIRVPSIGIMARYVRARVGIGFATQSTYETFFGGDATLGCIRLEDDWAKRTLRIVVPADESRLTGAAKKLLAHLRLAAKTPVERSLPGTLQSGS